MSVIPDIKAFCEELFHEDISVKKFENIFLNFSEIEE